MSGTLRKMRRLALAQHRDASHASLDDRARLRSWAERHDARLGPGQYWQMADALLAFSVRQLVRSLTTSFVEALAIAPARPSDAEVALIRSRSRKRPRSIVSADQVARATIDGVRKVVTIPAVEVEP